MANHLKKITAQATRIRKDQPGLSWTDAIKRAARQLKSAKKVGATLLLEKGESRRTKPKRVIQVSRKKDGTYKGSKQISGTRKYMGSLPQYEDPIAARKIELYWENNSAVYFRSRSPIIKNLVKKFKAGKYSAEKAALLIRHGIESAMKLYNQEHGSKRDKWSDLLSVNDRKLLSLDLAKQLEKELKHNPSEYDDL